MQISSVFIIGPFGMCLFPFIIFLLQYVLVGSHFPEKTFLRKVGTISMENSI